MVAPTKKSVKNKRSSTRVRIKQALVGAEIKSALSFLKSPKKGVLPLMNLSTKGCMYLSRRRVEPETMLHLNIDVPAFLDALISYAVVRWCRRMPNMFGVYQVGVEFVKLRGDGAKKIRDLAEDIVLRNMDRNPYRKK